MRKGLKGAAAVAMAAWAISTPVAAQEELTAKGPQGDLAGTLIHPADSKPIVLIIPGSGPTDRDGNSPLGVTAAPYRLLAKALAKHGIGSLRIDKRGMFGSKFAVSDANNVTINDYVDDVAAWVKSARKATDRECIWLLGHSEGGLVALAASKRVENLCGIILVAAPGRKLGDILRAQLQANPANAPFLDQALAAVDTLEAGQRLDVSDLHPALQGLFAPQVQGFLINMMQYDPAALVADVALPMLIVQGGKDIQIGKVDGEALHSAQPAEKYIILPDMNHVLKNMPGNDIANNLAAYRDPSIPVSPELVDVIVEFVGEV